jgi:hypothetical protein
MYCVVEYYKYFGGTFSLQDKKRENTSTLESEAVYSSKTLVFIDTIM